MDILTTIISSIFSFVNVPLIVSANFIVYFLIKTIETWNGEKILEKSYKKVITFGVCLMLAGVFLWLGIATFDIVLLSILIVPYSYNFIMKSLLETFNVHYNKENINLL